MGSGGGCSTRGSCGRRFWDVGDRTRADQRIWRVRYGGFWPRGPPPPIPGLAGTGALLEQALEEISRFAAAQAPSGIPPAQAMATLHAAQLAWVFGAMGSWNDLYLDGPAREEYERVSAALFTALTSAICAATSASAA